MTPFKFTAAAICLCISLLAFSPGRARAAAEPASAATGMQQSGMLPGGGAYIVRRDSFAPTVAVELWYRAPGAGYDNAYPGISRLAITALAASAPPHGTSLAELVTRIGGTLSINVYPDIAMVGASVPSTQAHAVIRAMTNAYFSATIDDAALKAALRDTAVASTESHFDPERILQDALFSHVFSAGPAHYAPLPASTQDFAKIPAERVRAFAARAFRRLNAVLTVVGDVDSEWASYVVAGAPARATDRVSDVASDNPIDSTVSGAPVDVTQAAQVGGIGFAWTGPPIADPKAATAMDFIADYLFDPQRGAVASQVRADNGDAFVSGQFITLHDPGILLVTVSGDAANTYRATVLDGVSAVQQPLDPRAFDAARNAFMYRILNQSQTPSARADNFGWYAAEGNAPYAPGDQSGQYLQIARSLDPQYVARIARTYLQHPAIVRLLSTPHAAGNAI